MQITTVFDIGQKVYLIVEYLNNWGGGKRSLNVIEETIIESMQVYGTKDDCTIIYGCEYGHFKETEFFSTKDQAEQKLKEKEAPAND